MLAFFGFCFSKCWDIQFVNWPFNFWWPWDFPFRVYFVLWFFFFSFFLFSSFFWEFPFNYDHLVVHNCPLSEGMLLPTVLFFSLFHSGREIWSSKSPKRSLMSFSHESKQVCWEILELIVLRRCNDAQNSFCWQPDFKQTGVQKAIQRLNSESLWINPESLPQNDTIQRGWLLSHTP